MYGSIILLLDGAGLNRFTARFLEPNIIYVNNSPLFQEVLLYI